MDFAPALEGRAAFGSASSPAALHRPAQDALASASEVQPLPKEDGWIESVPAPGGGTHDGPFEPGQVLARLELGAPRTDIFLLHGTIPLPPNVFPMRDGLSPFAVRDSWGQETPAQVEIVSRHANPEHGADVVEVIARVRRPKVATGQRIQYEVVWAPHAPQPLIPTHLVSRLVETPMSVVLSSHDVFGNEYRADLLTDLRESTPDQRVLRDGALARQVRTHEVMLPVRAESGPEGTLPHLFGVHAFVTIWDGEPFFSIDLRVHNGGDGLDLADTSDDPLGEMYFRELEIDVPPGWKVLQTFDDPTFGEGYDGGGVHTFPLIKPLPDGRMHFAPSQANFQRRLVVVRGGFEERALTARNSRDLAFCTPGFDDEGQELFSWWNGETSAYFPQKTTLPELWHLSRDVERKKLLKEFRPYLEALEAGTVGPYPVVVGNLGWAHPWGVQPGYAYGGQEIYLYDGLRTAWAGSSHGYRYHQLVTRQSLERHAVALFDADGDAIREQDWIVENDGQPYMKAYLWMWPVLQLGDPFGFGDAPDFQREYVDQNGLAPDYRDDLQQFTAIDTQHLVRHTRSPKVLAWLGNDALAKDEIRLQAELARMSYSPLPQENSGESILTGMCRDREMVDDFGDQGFGFDRGEGWILDTVVAAYALADEEWRPTVRPWFDELEQLVDDGISYCTGGLGSLTGDQGDWDQYRVRQSISEAILQNALWSLRRSVFLEGEAQHTRLTENLTRNLYYSISDVVWSDELHAPWFYIAVGPAELSEALYCTRTPKTQYTDNYQVWSSFAYGYELTGDPQFLNRAEELLGEPLSTPALGSGFYGFLENRSALMRLVQDLYE